MFLKCLSKYAVEHFDESISSNVNWTQRFAKAKLKLLTKQLEDGAELRLKMEEQTRDLQRQLKTEREENKRLTKRLEF